MESSSLEELVFDPMKCSKLSMEQKRELVYELSNWSDSAEDILQAWSRQDLLQILCAELGKERKYTGFTKLKMIKHLLKVVSDKKSLERGSGDLPETIANVERTPKKQRRSDNPNQVVSTADMDTTNVVEADNITYCKNSACKARMNHEDVFCKRCSCCICQQYDDNKDPSLWLVCSSDPPFQGNSCGMSCHLECALPHERSGITNNCQDKGLDGSFFCVSCGKVNDLLSSLRKQLNVARDTRRVDILCYRLSLSRKILSGTKHYQNLFGIIDEAVKKLEEDVGPLTGLPVKMARGIVNRLSSGPEVQKLCASAVDSLDLMLSNRLSDMPSDSNVLAAKLVRFEDSKNKEMEMHQADYQMMGNSQIEVIKINSTDVEVERSQSLATNCSTLSNPSSVEDETNNVMPCCNGDENRSDNYIAFCRTTDKSSSANFVNYSVSCSENQKGTIRDEAFLMEKEKSKEAVNLKNKDSPEDQTVQEMSTVDGSNIPIQTGWECVPYVDSLENNTLPITPCKLEHAKDGNGRNGRPKLGQKGVSDVCAKEEKETLKKSGERQEECTGTEDKDFEHCVKVIRWLECDGLIETTFRQKFLTWYSLRATPREVRVVKVFVEAFTEDPASLAGQLVDTFSDVISNKRCLTVPSGFCMKLWH